jgi:hypothetical protein
MSTKISQLTSATDITASDLMQIVDVEDGVMAPSGTNKKITAQLLADDLAGIVSDGSIATSKLASGALPSGVTVSSTNIVNSTIVDADVSASAAIAGSKISPSFTEPSVISVNSSSNALRITQTGTGDALVVEDSTNPDATPFVINADGRVMSGTTTILTASDTLIPRIATYNGQFGTFRYLDDAASNFFLFNKSRGTGTTQTIVQSEDILGTINFAGSDGTNFISSARIEGAVDGTPGTDDMPGRLVFSTTADGNSTPTERARIDGSGRLLVGTSSARSVGAGSFGVFEVERAGIAIAKITTNENSSEPSYFILGKSRGTTTGGSAVVQSGDRLGEIRFAGGDGTDLISLGASIQAAVDGTPGTDDMPGRLVFNTTADGAASPTERMRITSSGNVGIGTVTPSSKLHVAGDLTMSSATVATSATAGTNGDVPAQVEGYLVVSINGTARKIPYYA